MEARVKAARNDTFAHSANLRCGTVRHALGHTRRTKKQRYTKHENYNQSPAIRSTRRNPSRTLRRERLLVLPKMYSGELLPCLCGWEVLPCLQVILASATRLAEGGVFSPLLRQPFLWRIRRAYTATQLTFGPGALLPLLLRDCIQSW